jgi:hypothetical protein
LLVYYDAFLTQSYPGTGITVSNLAGSGNNALLYNSPTYDSTKPKVISFDGTNDHMIMQNMTINKTWSLEIVMKPGRIPAFSDFLFSQGDLDTNKYLEIRYTQTSGFAFKMIFGFYGSGTEYSIPTSLYDSSKYQHFVFTYQHSSPWTKNFYFNSSQRTANAGGSLAQYLGTRSGLGILCAYRVFEVPNTQTVGEITLGKLALVRMYDKVLTPAEVTQNYNSLRGRFGSLLA